MLTGRAIFFAVVATCSFRVGCDCGGRGSGDDGPCEPPFDAGGGEAADSGAPDDGGMPDSGFFALHCIDGVRDFGETDVDCGGPCLGCTDLKACNASTDCASYECDGGVCIVSPCVIPLPMADPTCVDLTSTGTLTASRESLNDPVIDTRNASCNDFWSSGMGPPQWVDLELPVETEIRGVSLGSEMLPFTGLVTHVLQIQTDAGYVMAATYSGQMSIAGSYVFDLKQRVPARHVRVLTTRSPSWVAWREISVWTCPP